MAGPRYYTFDSLYQKDQTLSRPRPGRRPRCAEQPGGPASAEADGVEHLLEGTLVGAVVGLGDDEHNVEQAVGQAHGEQPVGLPLALQRRASAELGGKGAAAPDARALAGNLPHALVRLQHLVDEAVGGLFQRHLRILEVEHIGHGAVSDGILTDAARRSEHHLGAAFVHLPVGGVLDGKVAVAVTLETARGRLGRPLRLLLCFWLWLLSRLGRRWQALQVTAHGVEVVRARPRVLERAQLANLVFNPLLAVLGVGVAGEELEAAPAALLLASL